jgi:acyl carrier protein
MVMQERLEEVIGLIIDVPAEKLSDDSNSDNTPGWDSLRQLSIIMAVESAYGVSISTKDALDMNSLGNIRAVLKNHGVEC